MAPDWWPKPWGPGEKDRVRHVEPDHLWKKERVYLLNHILRLVVEPREKQHPDIRRLNVNVAKLESVTMEALSSWFADNQNPNNAKKRPIVKELFRVAKIEEKYKNNEIGWPLRSIAWTIPWQVLTIRRRWHHPSLCHGR
ncbi:hypothetical protein VTK56DRAFT_7153 [Thermocarpiscus australiensis]